MKLKFLNSSLQHFYKKRYVEKIVPLLGVLCCFSVKKGLYSNFHVKNEHIMHDLFDESCDKEIDL